MPIFEDEYYQAVSKIEYSPGVRLSQPFYICL
jgi:hypothetical protein